MTPASDATASGATASDDFAAVLARFASWLTLADLPADAVAAAKVAVGVSLNSVGGKG